VAARRDADEQLDADIILSQQAYLREDSDEIQNGFRKDSTKTIGSGVIRLGEARAFPEFEDLKLGRRSLIYVFRKQSPTG
jgi:hypothetical protein